MVALDEIYEVEIESVNIFGNGVCHIDSFVVFVSDAIALEKCKIKITKVDRAFAYAKVIERVKISEKRIAPACSVYGRCGGCSFMHMSIDEENQAKLDFVKSTFKKNRVEADFAELSCPVNERYRNKVVLFYGEGGFGYNEKGSVSVVEHTSCYLNEQIFDEISEFSAEYLKNTPIRALYIRSGKGIMVAPIFYEPTDIISYTMALVNKFPQVEAVLNATFSDKDFILEKVKFKPVYGTGYIEDAICGLSFKISPKSFYQVNKQGAEKLYTKAIELLNAKKDQKIADLFCGTGTMGIITAKSTGAFVYGVEIEPEAVKDAKENAKINGVKNIHFEAMDAGKFNEKIDACIIDPPRKGCSQFMIDTLLRLRPEKIVYVSCNPDTMCRDIKALLREYEIASPVFTYNLFPRTTHVESVVCLTTKQ